MSSEPLIISGDFNFHMDVSHDSETIHFSDLLDSMGLIQHVKQPTHEKDHTLDLIITRQCDNIIAKEPLPERYFSDHAAVICELSTARSAQKVKHAEYRKLKSIDMHEFLKDLHNSNLCVNSPSDLDTLVDCYNKTLASLLDKHTPVQSRHVTTRVRPPWFNNDVIEGRRDRRKAERRWRATRLPANLAAFKAKRNHTIHVMNEAKRNYYKQFIEDNGDDQSKLFRASKRLLNMQSDKTLPPYTDAFGLANEMGDFFVRKITSIRSKLTAGDIDQPAVVDSVITEECHSVTTFSEFSPLPEEEIRKLVLANKKTCALDPIPWSILSLCLDELLPVLTKMVNVSLESGHFAKEWKSALVHPLLKKHGLELINKNFRPVSNLQFTSKLTEKAAASQIQLHMMDNDLLPELQSAYRQHHSTETALIKVKNDVLMNMDKGHVTLLVLLDLSAAFDTVDHGVLLRRLHSLLGLRGNVLSWFQSYLTDRVQRISIDGTLSNIFNLECGVPQGSCLGPLLFTIYTSKLFEVLRSHLPSAHAYADDTQLYFSFRPSDSLSEVDAVASMENCIREVRAWMKEDMLWLNDSKTEFLLIGSRKQLAKVTINSIKVGDADIAPVSSARNLGAWFDSYMDMSTHISKTCSSAFYYLYNIRHIRKYLSKEHTEQLIHAFITSRLDYCNSLLYGIPECQIKKLQRIMNASARLIYCAPKFCHITPILKELHWLPVRARIEFKLLLITYKVIKGLAPKYLSELLSVLPMSKYNLRRNNNGILLARSALNSKKTMGDRAFMIAAPILWNRLPLFIRQAATIDTFKSLLKTHLFTKSYN